MPIQQRKTKIQIDARYDANDRISIANNIIAYIQDRSNEGIGVSGKPDKQGLYESTTRFPDYTQDYINSEKFKRAGKSPFNIDLELRNKMLNAIQLLDHSSGYIEIGFKEGTKENAKAEGNIIGSYGGKPNSSKVRNFLGITRNELEDVLAGFPIIEDEELLEMLEREIDIEIIEDISLLPILAGITNE